MKRDIIVVAEDEELAGFKLAGVKRTYGIDTVGLANILAAEESLIFMSGKAMDKLEHDLDRIRARNMVQQIPAEGVGYLRMKRLIKDTLGFDLQ